MRFPAARFVVVLVILTGFAVAYSSLKGAEPAQLGDGATDVLVVKKKLIVGGAGKPSIALQSADHAASLSLLDAKQLPRAVVGYADAKEAGSLVVLYDDAGRKRAEVSIPNEGESVLALFDESGRKRIAASTSKETAGLSLWDTQDHLRIGFAIDGTSVTNTAAKAGK